MNSPQQVDKVSLTFLFKLGLSPHVVRCLLTYMSLQCNRDFVRELKFDSRLQHSTKEPLLLQRVDVVHSPHTVNRFEFVRQKYTRGEHFLFLQSNAPYAYVMSTQVNAGIHTKVTHRKVSFPLEPAKFKPIHRTSVMRTAGTKTSLNYSHKYYTVYNFIFLHFKRLT